jgi:hypothetical protein
MRIFETNIEILSKQLLPTFLRKPPIIAFLTAAAKPLVWLMQNLRIFRNENLYRLAITSQVCYLEKLLNERYGGGITITDGDFRDSTYIYGDVEQIPVFIYKDEELANDNFPVENRTFIYQKNEYGWNGVSFYINLPQGFDELAIVEIGALVSKFKLAGTTFHINH